MSEFYDNGAVKAAITSRECREKPKNKERDFPSWTVFKDWFDTQSEAEVFLADAKAMEFTEVVA